jgi:hypothetical protein
MSETEDQYCTPSHRLKNNCPELTHTFDNYYFHYKEEESARGVLKNCLYTCFVFFENVFRYLHSEN